MTTTTITIPPAEELDRRHAGESDALDLYLIPATDPGPPRVTTYADGTSRPGTPMPAWRGDWISLGRVRGPVRGVALRRLLTSDAMQAEMARALDMWADGNLDLAYHLDRLSDAIREALAEEEYGGYYQHAADWYAVAMPSWQAVARAYDIDPDAIYGEDWEGVRDGVVARLEAEDGDVVHHIAEWVREIVEDYRYDHG